MDPNEYASLEPLSPDALLEKGTAYQREIDGLEAEVDDLKAEKKEKEDRLKRFKDKIARIFHTRERGGELWILNGGELTDEPPDSDTLPLGDPPEEAPEEPADDAEAPEAADDEGEPPAPGAYPEEQPGQVYKGKSSAGNSCTVRESAPGSGKWRGLVSGKLCIQDVSLQEAFAGVEEKVGDTAEGIEWEPTLEIEDVDEDDVDADLAGVDL